MVKVKKTNINITTNLSNYIDGLLLSDGYIQRSNRPSLRYSQFCKYKEWLENINKDFSIFGLSSNIRIKKGFSSTSGNYFGYTLDTKSYVDFINTYNRWYKEWFDDPDNETESTFKKIIPHDIELSSECVFNWYLGDGCCHYHGAKGRYGIQLATNGFSKDDVIFICELLNNTIDVKAHFTKNKSVIITNINGVSEFLNYSLECGYNIPNCYSYKFPEGAM